MFAFKSKYFLIIENIKDINLNNIKKHNKFIIIYRPKEVKVELIDILKFRRQCKIKKIRFYVANNLKLCNQVRADGVYLSSYNKSLKALYIKKSTFEIIGSAHNFNQITEKIRQGCNFILLSKLFLVQYSKDSPYLGVVKYNNYLLNIYEKLIPLGGINSNNLNKLRNMKCYGFAILSEIKKKPAITNRLF